MLTALITGAASGIGLATAKLLARSGYHIVICDIRGADDAARAIAGAGGSAEGLTLDVGDVDAVKRAAETLRARHAHLGALVANAGVSGHGVSFAEVDVAAYEKMMAVHVRGHFFLTQQLLPSFQADSAIVFVSSVFARIGNPAMPHYAAAKGALLGLTKALAAELGPRGIRVNAVTPGLVRTPMTEKSAERRATLFDDELPRLALKRLTTPDEVAATIAWLLSPAASAITGQAISPSSGRIMAD